MRRSWAKPSLGRQKAHKPNIRQAYTREIKQRKQTQKNRPPPSPLERSLAEIKEQINANAVNPQAEFTKIRKHLKQQKETLEAALAAPNTSDTIKEVKCALKELKDSYAEKSQNVHNITYAQTAAANSSSTLILKAPELEAAELLKALSDEPCPQGLNTTGSGGFRKTLRSLVRAKSRKPSCETTYKTWRGTAKYKTRGFQARDLFYSISQIPRPRRLLKERWLHTQNQTQQ